MRNILLTRNSFIVRHQNKKVSFAKRINSNKKKVFVRHAKQILHCLDNLLPII